MIRIERPIFSRSNTHCRITANIYEDDIKKSVWFEVESRYGEYLTWERGDAFVISLLNYAMRFGHDIVSEAPLGEDLYYKITKELVKTLADNSKVLKNIKISAPVDCSSIRIGEAVGTGISCGIDSLHVLAINSNSQFKNHNITHLAFNNVGSHGFGEKAKKLYEERHKLAKDFANINGYEYVESNSNLYDAFYQEHILSHTYSSCFAILCMQKLYKTYYYASSGATLDSFSVKSSEKKDPAYYELLSLNCFSSRDLKIYSEGCSLTRFEKTKDIVDYEPSYKFLNVCVPQFKNCGECNKCRRTLYTLDVLDKLDKYTAVFNIDKYLKYRQKYYRQYLVDYWYGDVMLKPLYKTLRKKIYLSTYIGALIYFMLSISKRIITNFLCSLK